MSEVEDGRGGMDVKSVKDLVGKDKGLVVNTFLASNADQESFSKDRNEGEHVSEYMKTIQVLNSGSLESVNGEFLGECLEAGQVFDPGGIHNFDITTAAARGVYEKLVASRLWECGYFERGCIVVTGIRIHPDKFGTKPVILELLELGRETERPLSSLVNMGGPTCRIEMLFVGKTPIFRIENTLGKDVLMLVIIVEAKQVFDPGGKRVCNLGGGEKDFHKLKWKTNYSVVVVISGGPDIRSSITASFALTLCEKEHQWFCDMNEFWADSFSWYLKLEVGVGVESDMDNDVDEQGLDDNMVALVNESTEMDERVTRLVLQVAAAYRDVGKCGRYGIRDDIYLREYGNKCVRVKAVKFMSRFNGTFTDFVVGMGVDITSHVLLRKSIRVAMKAYVLVVTSGGIDLRVFEKFIGSESVEEPALIRNTCDELFESMRRSCEYSQWNYIMVIEVDWDGDKWPMKNGVSCVVVESAQEVPKFNHPGSSLRMVGKEGPETDTNRVHN